MLHPSTSAAGLESFQLAPTWSYHKNLTRALCMTDAGDLIIHRIFGVTLWECTTIATQRYRSKSTGVFWPGFSNVRPYDTLDPPLIKVDYSGQIWLDTKDQANHIMWVESISKNVLEGLFDGMCWLRFIIWVRGGLTYHTIQVLTIFMISEEFISISISPMLWLILNFTNQPPIKSNWFVQPANDKTPSSTPSRTSFARLHSPLTHQRGSRIEHILPVPIVCMWRILEGAIAWDLVCINPTLSLILLCLNKYFIDSNQIPGAVDLFDASTSAFLNKYPHVAPELTKQGHAKGYKEIGPAADVYALGIIIWRLIYNGLFFTKHTEAIRSDPRFTEKPSKSDWINYASFGEYQGWKTLWDSRADNPSKRPLLKELKNWLMAMEMAW